MNSSQESNYYREKQCSMEINSRALRQTDFTSLPLLDNKTLDLDKFLTF